MDNILNFTFLSESLKKNQRSSLFPILADELFLRGEIDKAISILENGLLIFPNFSNALFLLGQCYLKKNDVEKAISCFEKVLISNPFHENCTKSLNEILEKINNEQSFMPFQEFRKTHFAEIKKTDLLSFEEYKNLHNKSFLIDKIADEISQAQRITLNENEITEIQNIEESSNDYFFTPTLAEIFVKQNKFSDAILAYQKLSELNPNEKDNFNKRISEIKSLIDQTKKPE